MKLMKYKTSVLDEDNSHILSTRKATILTNAHQNLLPMYFNLI